MRVPHAGCSLKLRLLLLLVQCCLVTGRLAWRRSAIAWGTFRGSGISWSTSRRAPPGRARSPWRSSTASRSLPGSTPGASTPASDVPADMMHVTGGAILASDGPDDMIDITAETYMQFWSQASPTHAFLSDYSRPESAREQTGVCLTSKCGASGSLGLCSLRSSTRHCSHVKLGLHTPLNSALHDSPIARLAVRALHPGRPPAQGRAKALLLSL